MMDSVPPIMRRRGPAGPAHWQVAAARALTVCRWITQHQSHLQGSFPADGCASSRCLLSTPFPEATIEPTFRSYLSLSLRQCVSDHELAARRLLHRGPAPRRPDGKPGVGEPLANRFRALTLTRAVAPHQERVHRQAPNQLLYLQGPCVSGQKNENEQQTGGKWVRGRESEQGKASKSPRARVGAAIAGKECRAMWERP